jgi:hypothetical protein
VTVSFDLDGKLVLYTPQSRQLYLLNPAARLIWLALDAGLSHDEAARSLADAANIPIAAARRDCTTVIQQWQDAGLLDNATDSGAVDGERVRQWWPEPQSWNAGPQDGPILEAVYRIGGFCFLLRSADSDPDRVAHDYLAYIACPASDPDYVLELTRRGAGWELALQGRQIDRCEGPETLVPMLYRTMFITAWRGSGCSMAIHAALLVRGARTLLIAGTSGAGKSTLTAALAARGFNLCSDDMALLSASPMRVHAVPTPIRLRENSWPLLEPFWPQLASLPVHPRKKGGGVRFLLPPNTLTQGTGTGYEADVLVFSRYRAGSAAIVEKLGRAETLMLLTEAGYDFGDVISEDLIGELIDWITGLQCYRLEYDDLDDAVSELRALTEKRTPAD